MKKSKPILYIFIAFLINVIISLGAEASTIRANSCSTADVNTAVIAASNGDVITIPNGSCTWTSGISTTKQIWIRALNYTPTSGGNATRNVIITNNSSSGPLFQLTSGNSYNVRISGIRFNEGTGTSPHVRFYGTGTKVPLVDDCYFEVNNNRYGTAEDVAAISWASRGGVLWNVYILGTQDGGGDNLWIKHPSPSGSWSSASTMGMLDTDGTANVYMEDSTCLNATTIPDLDQGGRFVHRYSLIDGCNGSGHGFTSYYGQRHVEYYNNTFTTTTANRNIAARYYWMRQGTGVFTDNTVYVQNRGYGDPVLLKVSCTEANYTCTGSYPLDRQVGMGHNGTDDISDPVYIWNQSGPGAYTWGNSDSYYIQLNRDIYVNNGAKPGYSKYTYPHPARNEGPPGTKLSPPTILQIQ